MLLSSPYFANSRVIYSTTIIEQSLNSGQTKYMMSLLALIFLFAYANVDVEANFATFFCYGDKNDDSILNQNDLNTGTQNLGWLSEFKELLRDQNDSSPSNKIPLEMAYLEGDEVIIMQDITWDDFKKMSIPGSRNILFI